MKILIIVDVVDNGGVGIVLRNLLANINLTKYEIEIITFEKMSEYESLLPADVKVRHLYLSNPAKNKNRYVRYLYGFLREICPKWFIRTVLIRNAYDLAIDFKGNNLNVLNALKCPKLFWSHKDFSPETNPIEKRVIEEYSKTKIGAAKNKIFRKNLQQVDGVVCISEACKNAFSERWQYSQQKITVLLNILDVAAIQSRANEKIVYSKSGVFTFCCMSRISSGKGIERLLNCVKELNCIGYIYVLNIIGGGDKLDEMIEMSREKGLDNVVFFGNQDNPYPYVMESDVFVYPSETEAYSMAVCEALILGKAIITTKTASVPEIFGNNEYGLVVENNKNSIFAGMKSFLDKPEFMSYYHELAVKRIGYFDVKIRARAVEEFLDEFEKNT